MAADLSGQLTAIDNTLNSALDKAAMVPFLNGQQGLLDAKSFVDSVNAQAQLALAPFKTDPTGGANDAQLETDVKQALFNYLGPPTKQFPKALNVVGALSDISVHITGDGAHNNVNVAVEVALRQTVAVVQTPNLKFGLGLPALPFQTTAAGGVQLKVGFDFELKFGYDQATNTFSLGTNNSDAQLNFPQGKLPYNISGHLFAVEAQATLVNFSAGVDIGFFGGSATDAGNTALNAALVIDDLTNPTDVGVLGAADVNLALTLGIIDGKSGGPPDANFPSVNTTFALHWDFTDNSPPTAAFNNVSLSLGALFSDVISPQLLTYVQDFTKPLQPLFDVLKARLPVVSDLAGQTVSLESLLKEGAKLNLFGPYSALVGLATNLVDITNFVNQLKGSGDQLIIDVGNFDLSGGNADLRNMGTATLADALKGANWDKITSLTDPNAWQSVLGAAPDLNSVADGIKSQLDKIAGNNPGLKGVVRAAEKLLPTNVASFDLSFPFFDDPANGVFRLLLGQDPDLVSFSATLKLAAQVGAQSFGVPDLPGLSADFTSEIDVDAYFKAAYDTYGMRQFIHDALNGNINVGDLANGFYLATDDSNNPDHPNGCHLNLSGGIKAGPKLDLVFFQAGVDASISANLHLWATDPGGTGKFRLNELQSASDLFNANGDVEAGLTAYTRVGVDLPVVGFVGTENDYDIAHTRLIDFGTSSVTVNPYMVPSDLELATPDPSDPTRLLLNLGQRASFLTADKALAGQKDVTFSVSHVANNANGGEVLQVSAFGFQQQFGKEQGIKTIVVEGADGNDMINIGSDQKPVLADADITEGNGNVQVQYLGSGNAHVIAGNGNDVLQGGTGYNYFRTGSGSSSLLGGDGSTASVAPFWNGQATTANGALYVNDFETGAGAGANALQGGRNALNHLVAAGAGTNRLVAGNLDDYLQAGRGTDTLIAGLGQDTIFLPGGTNTVDWQVGDGNLTVSTGGAAVGFSTNALEVGGSDQNDTFTLSPNPNDPTGLGVQVQADAAQINWAGFVQKVSIDGGKGDDTTTVNDLSGSSVKDVGLNDGAALAPDGGQDVVNVEGSPKSHTITVATESAFLHPDGPVGGVMLVQTAPQYKVHVAVTNGADTLNVFAKGRGNTVDVKSNTGHTVINADAGDDLFNVSSDAPADDGVLLDHPLNRPPFGLFGQLDLHAGPGVNTLNLSESGSTQKDDITVTDSSVVGGVLTSSDPTNNNRPVRLVYRVNYDAVGTFFGGINVKASQAADTIDILSLPANASASVTTDGAAHVVVGSDPTHPAKSSLDTIRSPLVVVDNAGHEATVVLNDRGTPRSDVYTVSTLNLPPGVGEVNRGRSPADAVFFEGVAGVVLNTPAGQNTVVVTGTPAGTETDVNLGPGINRVHVGSAGLTLAPIKGPVFVKGRSGKDQLTLDDQNGPPTLAYAINTSAVAGAQSAAVHFQKVGRVVLIGGTSDESYAVQGVPTAPLLIVGQGSANLLVGPNRVNRWAVTGADAGTLDQSITFSGIQNLTGGNARDTFTFAKSGTLSGAIDGQAPSSLATRAGFRQADATVQADVSLLAGQSVTLLARHNTATNSTYGARLVWTGSDFEPVIFRTVHGVTTVLATGPVIPSASGTLSFQVIGHSLRLSLNNKPLVSAIDTALAMGDVDVLFGPGVSVRNFTAF